MIRRRKRESSDRCVAHEFGEPCPFRATRLLTYRTTMDSDAALGLCNWHGGALSRAANSGPRRPPDGTDRGAGGSSTPPRSRQRYEGHTAVVRAEARGHEMEWNPPATSWGTPDGPVVGRWTCTGRDCGATVLDNHGLVYGDALDRDCGPPGGVGTPTSTDDVEWGYARADDLSDVYPAADEDDAAWRAEVNDARPACRTVGPWRFADDRVGE